MIFLNKKEFKKINNLFELNKKIKKEKKINLFINSHLFPFNNEAHFDFYSDSFFPRFFSCFFNQYFEKAQTGNIKRKCFSFEIFNFRV